MMNLLKILVDKVAHKNILTKYGRAPKYVVTVVGANGGIGQSLSLLLQNNDSIKQLRLHDVRDVGGVAADLSHLDTITELKAYKPDCLQDALKNTDIAIVCAGIPRKPGMTRDELFDINSNIMAEVMTNVAIHCPGASILIISNPVNSLVPLAAEILRKYDSYDPRKLMGITKLDGIRAATFLSDVVDVHPKEIVVPVVGGHSGETIVPLFSQTHLPEIYGQPHENVDINNLTDEQYKTLIHRVQFGGDEVVQAKQGTGSATLAMAYSAAAFTDKLIRGLEGEHEVNEVAYVESDLGYSTFFASRVNFGRSGIRAVLPVGPITNYENNILQKMLPTLNKQIEKGIDFAKNYVYKEKDVK